MSNDNDVTLEAAIEGCIAALMKRGGLSKREASARAHEAIADACDLLKSDGDADRTAGADIEW